MVSDETEIKFESGFESCNAGFTESEFGYKEPALDFLVVQAGSCVIIIVKKIIR